MSVGCDGPEASGASGASALVARLAAALVARGGAIVTAESCTGGLVAAACTARPGSSAWFERGVVTYSNAAKRELLDVPERLLDAHGAVSAEVASSMAKGALARTPSARWSVAVTGVAGPDGGSDAKPVGTVWIATCARGEDGEATLLYASGDRSAVRAQSVVRALELLLARVEASPPSS